MGIVRFEDLAPEEQAQHEKIFEEKRQKERKFFKDRGFGEADMMYADAEYKSFLSREEKMPDRKPFDHAPMFRRAFMMGYFYGRASK